MQYESKFKMTKDQNIFWARRNQVDSIWKMANLEGINVSYPDVVSVCGGINVPSLSVERILFIVNLKHCWEIVSNTIDGNLTVDYINQLEEKLGAPEVININDNDFEAIMDLEPTTRKALMLMMYLLRKQVSIITAQLVANKILIENGCGLISVPTEKIDEFKKLQQEFLESNDYNVLMEFLYEQCITGMDPVVMEQIEDEYDAKVADAAYAEYVESGCKSTPIDELWRELF